MRRLARLGAGVAGLLLATTGIPAWGQACGLAGDLRHSRTLAISLALAGDEAGAASTSGDPFVRGYVELLSGHPEKSLDLFGAAADGLPKGRNDNRTREATSRIAYWSSVALGKLGHQAASLAAAEVASHQGLTFYGLLAGAPTRDPGGESYPTPQYRYVDERAPQALVWAITREESRFRKDAVSSAGALGLMQVMPRTAMRMTMTVGVPVDTGRMLHDPHYAVAVGSTYLGLLTRRYHGYAPLVAAAYNAGEGCADIWVKRLGDPRTSVDPLTWIEAIPFDETREYVQRVMASYQVYLSAAH